jgi:hypothetical protein
VDRWCARTPRGVPLSSSSSRERAGDAISVASRSSPTEYHGTALDGDEAAAAVEVNSQNAQRADVTAFFGPAHGADVPSVPAGWFGQVVVGPVPAQHLSLSSIWPSG